MRPNRVYSACCMQHYMPAATKAAIRYLTVVESLELQLAFSVELRVFIVISSLMSIVFAKFVRFALCHHSQVYANLAGWFTLFCSPQ